MHGNVWEWCRDRYGRFDGDAIDPVGVDSGLLRSCRGGSWDSAFSYCCSGARLQSRGTSASSANCGFRLMCFLMNQESCTTSVDEKASVKKNELIECKNKILFPRLLNNQIYHITSLKNLESILKGGLRARSLIVGSGMKPDDISNPKIQEKRHSRLMPGGMFLHDYVPFYFNPTNSMLFRVYKTTHRDIIILGIDSSVINENSFFASNRNAAADNACFGNTQDFIDQMNWDMIYSKSWDGDNNIKQIMQSEMLILDEVMVDKIKRIYCPNIALRNTVREICEKVASTIDVVSKPDMFFDHTHRSIMM